MLWPRIIDQVVKIGLDSIGNNLSKDFVNNITKRYEFIVFNSRIINLLGDKNQVSFFSTKRNKTIVMEIFKDLEESFFDGIP